MHKLTWPLLGSFGLGASFVVWYSARAETFSPSMDARSALTKFSSDRKKKKIMNYDDVDDCLSTDLMVLKRGG